MTRLFLKTISYNTLMLRQYRLYMDYDVFKFFKLSVLFFFCNRGIKVFVFIVFVSDCIVYF